MVGVGFGALGLWGLQQIWVYAGELDAGPSRHGIQKRLMQRKSDAMHDLLDAALAGRLRRVETAADRIETSAEGIEEYLSTEIYATQGQEFFEAVKAVRQAAQQGDHKATNEAALRLERSCLGCHQELILSGEGGPRS